MNTGKKKCSDVSIASDPLSRNNAYKLLNVLLNSSIHLLLLYTAVRLFDRTLILKCCPRMPAMHRLGFVFIVLLVTPTMCHGYAYLPTPFFEGELYQGSSYPEDDWSLETPFVVPLGSPASLLPARVFSSLLPLRPDDLYDAAVLKIAENMTDKDSVVVGLQVLTPDCPGYESFYPALALLGPVTNPNFPEINETVREKLPFDIPEGYGAIIRDPPRERRESIQANPFHSFLLPPFVSAECMSSAEAFRSCGDGKAAKVSLITDIALKPGRYYVVWWDPDRTDAEDSFETREVDIGMGFESASPENFQGDMHASGKDVPDFFPCIGTFVDMEMESTRGE